jgi:CRP-like cAMP-binding protein
MSNEDKLEELLESVMSLHATKKPDSSFMSSLANETMRFVKFEKGDYLTHMGSSLERILIQTEGQVSVFKYSHGGANIRGDLTEAPQIYGLYEALNGIKEHGATLQAATTVSCAIVSPAFFLQAIRNNHKIALHALSFLARFTDKMLNRNDQLTMNTPYENILIYFFEKSVGRALPVVIPSKKNEIAEQLNISNRTMYRLLEQLEQEGLIERSHGKIVVSKESFKKIQAKYYTYRNGLDPKTI